MLILMNKYLLVVSALIGVLLGIIGSRFLFVGSALSLIPWGIVGLLLGWFSKNRKKAKINGIIYGFFLCFSFMIAGYSGSAPLLTRMPFFAVLGLFGSVCGLILAIIGNLGKKLRK